MGRARQIIESEILQRPAHEWYVLTSGTAQTCGQHSFRDGDREVPAADPIDAEWFDYRDVDLKSHEDVLTGQRCALLYASGSASSYHTRFGDWAILVDLQPDDAQAMSLESWKAYDWSQDLKRSALGQRGGLDLYEEFAYTNEEDLNNILRSRSHMPNRVERADSFRQPGETSEEWWERRVNIANADDWMRKKDGD